VFASSRCTRNITKLRFTLPRSCISSYLTEEIMSNSSSSGEEDNQEEDQLLRYLQEDDQQEQMESSDTRVAANSTNQAGGEKSITRRLRWLPVPKVFSGSAAKTSLTYFLANTNVKDVMLTRQLIVQKPYSAEYGTKQKNWDDFAKRLNEEVGLHGQSDIFGCVLTAKNCQARFAQLIDFAKKYSAHVPFRSGDDSEPPPTELLTAIEDIYEDFSSQQNIKQLSKNDTLVGKERDKAAAEILRRSALGLPIPQVPPDHPQRAIALLEAEIRKQNRFVVVNDGVEGDPEGDAELDHISETPAMAMVPGASAVRRSNSSGRASRNSGRSGVPTPVTLCLEEALGKQADNLHAKSQLRAENKKRELDLQQQRIDMENKRIASEETRELRRMEMEERMEQQRLASEERMQTLMLSFMQSKNTQQDKSDNQK
jgi:hypothetical protein